MDSVRREEALAVGRREAQRFMSSVPNIMNRTAERNQRDAYDWLEAVVQNGRTVLLESRASDAEIELWYKACRIMFLLSTIRARNVNLL